MKTFKNNQGEEYLFIEVPLEAYDINLNKFDTYSAIGYKTICDCIEGYSSWRININNSSFYQIISTTKDITEKIAEKVIDKFEQKIGWRLDGDTSKLNSIVLFQNYKYEKPVPVTFLLSTAKESLQSLLDSLELKSDNYLILKKI